jgi:ferredoxin-type protein NapH
MNYLITGIRFLFLGLFFFLLVKGKIMLWLGLYGVSLVAALIFGRIYCGYACPMNTLMVPTEWLSKKLNLQTKHTPKWLSKGYFPWLALIISLVAMIVAKRILQVNIPILPIWLVISILVTLRYKPAVFHNLICPFSAPQRVFGKFARLSKNTAMDSCIGCKICEKSCPSEAIAVAQESKKAIIDPALCHQCNNCADACPENAIHYNNQKVYKNSQTMVNEL